MRRLLRHAFTLRSAISLMLCVGLLSLGCWLLATSYQAGRRHLIHAQRVQVSAVGDNLEIDRLVLVTPNTGFYDLRAHAKGERCPECGTPVPASDL